MSPLNSRLGFYYYPDDQHYTQVDLDTWLPRLKSLGAKWITLKANPARAIPEPFILGLKDSGIEPVIHIPCRMGSVHNSDLSSMFVSYANWGVRYVSVHDRPNLKSQWSATDWCRTGLVERFIDLILPILMSQQSAGLRPLLPPLEPGGDYWDTAFLEAALESLVRRGKQDLLQDLTLAIYAWTYDKPLDWGSGGFSSWPEARPYHTPPNCQDQIGFRIFDWYSEVVKRVVQIPMPMLVIAGGELPSHNDSGIGPDNHAEKNLAIARSLATTTVPETVLNYAFYHLASTPDHSDHFAAWYKDEDNPLPAVNTFLRLSNIAVKKPTAPEVKPFEHYVLLPQRQYQYYAQSWEAISNFALNYQPMVGFSPKEARLAKCVTLFGDENVISKDIEEQLCAAGCKVQRFTKSIDRDFVSATGPSVAKSHSLFDVSITGDPNA
jgi:hypothetical protein